MPELFFKVYLIFLFSVICISGVMGQLQLLNSSNGQISAEISITNGQLQLENPAIIQGSGIRSFNLTLENDDLLLHYELQKGKQEDEYRVEIQASLNGVPVKIHPDDLLGDYNHKMAASTAEPKLITWAGLLDRYYVFEGNLKLTLRTELWGKPTLPYGVDCAEKPVFGAKQKLPFYLAAGVGAIGVGISILIGSDAQKIYDDSYLLQRFEQAAEPYYQDANKKRHTALIVRYSGVAVLVADAAFFLYKQNRYKKKLDTFNEFCRNAQVSITPVYEPTSGVLNGAQLGLKLAYRF